MTESGSAEASLQAGSIVAAVKGTTVGRKGIASCRGEMKGVVTKWG